MLLLNRIDTRTQASLCPSYPGHQKITGTIRRLELTLQSKRRVKQIRRVYQLMGLDRVYVWYRVAVQKVKRAHLPQQSNPRHLGWWKCKKRKKSKKSKKGKIWSILKKIDVFSNSKKGFSRRIENGNGEDSYDKKSGMWTPEFRNKFKLKGIK